MTANERMELREHRNYLLDIRAYWANQMETAQSDYSWEFAHSQWGKVNRSVMELDEKIMGVTA